MTNVARVEVVPKLGLYHSPALGSRWADSPRREKCLYLALLPTGKFVRTLAPVGTFDFAAYVAAVATGLERGAARVSVVQGQHFHHLGEFSVSNGRLQFVARIHRFGEAFVQRWMLEVVTREFVVGRGEVYRWYDAE